MTTRKFNKGHAGRLRIGKVVLANANRVDTSLIEARLAAFAEQQTTYADAQNAVDDSLQRRNEHVAKLADLDAAQHTAVEKLALALANDGQPLSSPLAAFTSETRASLKTLPQAECAKAIHKLAAAVLRHESLSRGSRDAAGAAHVAARSLEDGLLKLAAIDDSLGERRHDRDAVGDRWDESLAALKRGARAAADEGAAGLYAALFELIGKPVTRKSRAAPKKDDAAAA